LAGGNVWNSLADLLKIMKLRGVGSDDVKEVWEIVQHLFTNIVRPARSKRDSRQAKTHVDYLLFQLVDDMLSMWDADSFLDRAQQLVKKAMHTMGTSFVGKVRDVRQIAEAQIGQGVADMVEFEARVNGHEATEKANRNGHEATEKANRIQAWQGLLEWQLADRFNRDRPVLLLPGCWWSGKHEPEFQSADGGKSRQAERGASNAQGVGSSRSLVRTFTRCNWVEVASA